MAHYLAERLDGLEGLQDEERRAAEGEIVELILQFWQQRWRGTFGVNPVAELDAIERTLERLDPQRPAWAYHRGFRGGNVPGEDDLVATPLLRAAEAVDRRSGDVVRQLLTAAADQAVREEASWVAAVLAAEVPGPDRWLQRLLDGEGTWDPQSDAPWLQLIEEATGLADLLQTLVQFLRAAAPAAAGARNGERDRRRIRGLARGVGDVRAPGAMRHRHRAFD